MKKLKYIFMTIVLLELAFLAMCKADIRSVSTDSSGNILNTPLTSSNQISMVASPTNNPLYLVRYKDLTNAIGGASIAGVAYLASNNLFTAANTFRGSTIVTNANFQMWNGVSQLQVYSTNVSQSSGSGQARVEFYTPAFTQGTIFGLAGATNTILTGSLPGDQVFRSETGVRTIWGEGTSIRAFMAPVGGASEFVLGGSTALVASNNLIVAGGTTLVGATTVSNTFASSSTMSISNTLTVGGQPIWVYTTAPANSIAAIPAFGTRFISFTSNFIYIGSANINGTGTNWVRVTGATF